MKIKRIEYEQIHGTENTALIDSLLKSSYIDELHQALERNIALFERKGKLFFLALQFALFSLMPFVACIGFKISQKESRIQQVEIVNLLSKDSNMSNDNTTKPAI